MIYIIYFLVGISTGLFAGLLGLGGGIVVVPSLLLIFKITGLFPDSNAMHIAVGTSLATMIFTSSASSYSYNRKRFVIWPILWRLLPGLSIGVIVGSIIARQISSQTLTDYFGIILILIAIHIFFRHKPSLDSEELKLDSLKKILLFFLSIVVGLLAAFFGLGGGILVIPTLIFFGLNIRQAAGTAAMCGLPSALLGTALFMISNAPIQIPGLIGFVYWPAAVIIATSSMLFAPLGVKVATNIPHKVLRRIFSITLITAGLNLIDPMFKLIRQNLL